MKSLISMVLAILPLLSFILFNVHPATARIQQQRRSINSSREPKSSKPVTTTTNPTPKRYLAPAPHWVAYTLEDYSKTQVLPTGSQLVGYNVFIMSFWLSMSGPAYKAAEFTSLSQSTRNWIINDYHSHGISFLVSAFGYGDTPTSSNEDPVAIAKNLAAFVKEYHLDGVDLDYEDFSAFWPDNGRLEAWLGNFTVQLRKELPAGQYIITHAPIAPWFTNNTDFYPAGAYRTIHKEVGNLIDWYNIQYYNQGSDYLSCDSLLTASLNPTFPNTAMFQINQFGVPLNKLVIGKPATPQQAANGGYMDLKVLAGCLEQAKQKGWKAGAMLWQYPDANASAIATVRKQSWKV